MTTLTAIALVLGYMVIGCACALIGTMIYEGCVRAHAAYVANREQKRVTQYYVERVIRESQKA